MSSNSFADMSKLIQSIKNTEDLVKCMKCIQYYKKKWHSADDNQCYFCKNFLPTKDTISSILRDIDWRYLKSGEISRREYYNEFIDNLNKWATRFSLLLTKQDLQTIEELRGVMDWSCDEPDYDY
jgi:hypothetical protein